MDLFAANAAYTLLSIPDETLTGWVVACSTAAFLAVFGGTWSGAREPTWKKGGGGWPAAAELSGGGTSAAGLGAGLLLLGTCGGWDTCGGGGMCGCGWLCGGTARVAGNLASIGWRPYWGRVGGGRYSTGFAASWLLLGNCCEGVLLGTPLESAGY